MKPVSALKFVILALLIFVASCAKIPQVVIVHFNDTHSVMYPFIDSVGQSLGGAARRVTLIKELRAKYPDLLLIHAGDALTGSIFSSVFKGAMSIELMNNMKFDMMTVGNHEFDYGYSNSIVLKDMAKFPILSANIYSRKSGERVFLPYIIKTVNGIKIVFVGLTTSNVGVINQDVVKKDISIKPEIEELRGLLDTYKLMDTNDLLICVTHSGYTQDMELAAAISEIDVIIGGHTHTEIFTPLYISNAIIVQAGKYGFYAGLLMFDYENGKITNLDYRLMNITSNTVADPETVQFISNKQKIFQSMMTQFICESEVYLEQHGIRENPLPLGNFIADMMWKAAPGVDMAIVNAGSIRYYLPDGVITLGDVIAVSPFDNELCVVKLQGKYIKEIMKAGLANRGQGAFLYYSKGVKIIAEGVATPQFTFNGKPIDDNKTYKVAVSDFMVAGGDNYSQFAKGLSVDYTGLNVRDIIIEFLKKLKKITNQAIDSQPRLILPMI